MGKYLAAQTHITELNILPEPEATELTSWRVANPASAILKRQESRGIQIVSSQRKFLFDIYD